MQERYKFTKNREGETQHADDSDEAIPSIGMTIRLEGVRQKKERRSKYKAMEGGQNFRLFYDL